MFVVCTAESSAANPGRPLGAFRTKEGALQFARYRRDADAYRAQDYHVYKLVANAAPPCRITNVAVVFAA